MTGLRLLLAAVLFLVSSAPDSSQAAEGRPRAGFVETAPGVKIRVIDVGSRTAPLTLVLVPGWRFTADIWKEQIAAFAGRHRVIAIDPRSQGASTKATDGNTAETRAQDLHEVLAKLHVGPIVLVGWSQGAQDISAYVARFGTADVRGLVFVDAAPSRGWEQAVASPGAAQRLHQVSLYARYPKEATDGMMQSVFRTPRSKTDLDALVADALRTPPTVGAAILEDDLFGPDRMTPLAHVAAPALLVAADTSLNGDDLASLAKVLPRSRSITVPGAGHAVFVDQPARFNAAIEEFVASL